MSRITYTIILTLLCAVGAHAEPRTVYVSTPDLCRKVGEVKGNQVYLVSTGAENCVQALGKIAASVDAAYLEVNIYVDGRFWRKEGIAAASFEGVRSMQEGAQRQAEGLQDAAQKMKTGVENYAPARQLGQQMLSPEYQVKVEVQKRQVAERMGIPYDKQVESLRGAPAPGQVMGMDERVYLFLSSSVPFHAIRRYAHDIAALGEGKQVVMVFRNNPNGGMKKLAEIAKFYWQIVAERDDCPYLDKECKTASAAIVIDPNLFSRYGISKVPTFVHASGVQVLYSDSSEGEKEVTVADWRTVTGDARLEKALETLGRCSRAPALLVAKLRHKAAPEPWEPVPGACEAKEVLIGQTYPILESDAAADLQKLAEQTDWQKYFNEQRVGKSVRQIDPVDATALPHATKDAVRLVDVAYTLPEDHKQPCFAFKSAGRPLPAECVGEGWETKLVTLYPKGFRFNPLDFVVFATKYVVIDGQDRGQVEWFMASPWAHDPTVKLLAVKGTPYFGLSKDLQRPVFYAKKELIERFQIQRVPSIVQRAGDKMQVTEVYAELQLHKGGGK